MEGIWWVLPALACGAMMAAMGLMMWRMGKDMLPGRKQRTSTEKSDEAQSDR